MDMGTWVRVDRTPISYAICGDEAELQLGERFGGFEMLATETGLEKLAEAVESALRELRTHSDADPAEP